MSGTKHDSGKAPISLIPHESLMGTARVLAFGAKKYAAHNWRGGFEWSRLLDAALRHITAFNSGEDCDPESGLPHVDHAACCIAFLQAHYHSNLGTDDRYVDCAKQMAEEVADMDAAAEAYERIRDTDELNQMRERIISETVGRMKEATISVDDLIAMKRVLDEADVPTDHMVIPPGSPLLEYVSASPAKVACQRGCGCDWVSGCQADQD